MSDRRIAGPPSSLPGMARYTQDSIERVKDAIDMVELVGARSDLRRAGTQWKGLCPFHDERSPSFSVNPDRKLYYCFGCGVRGDAIAFVRETEALDFQGAVEWLADRYGVELQREAEDPQAEARRRRRERLAELVERAAAYYERYLWESQEAARAREYLAGRGLGAEVLREFRIGYAPSRWDTVTLRAQRDGFRPEELVAAGLAQQRRGGGGFYDRFRARIMFPLADSRGRVLGFGARSLSDDQPPKYINTSENELYHKGRQLFGIDRARAAAAKRGRIVAVEGYTDVLALHQGGITESVAIMGTALTQEQLAELSRAVGVDGGVYMALDADRAGQEAMLRAGRGARERDVELRVTPMPGGMDPAELVERDGAAAFEDLLARAVTVHEFEVRRRLEAMDPRDPVARDRALADVLPIIQSVPASSVLRDHLVKLAADKLDVPLDNLHVQIAAAGRATPGAPPRFERAREEDQGRPASPSIEGISRAEREFLAMCLADESQGREYLGRLDDDHFSSAALRRVCDHLVAHFDDPLADLPEDDPAVAALVTDVAMRGDDEHFSGDALRLTFLQLELQRVMRQLRHAERDGNLERQRELWPIRESVRLQIDELMGQTL